MQNIKKFIFAEDYLEKSETETLIKTINDNYELLYNGLNELKYNDDLVREYLLYTDDILEYLEEDYYLDKKIGAIIRKLASISAKLKIDRIFLTN